MAPEAMLIDTAALEACVQRYQLAKNYAPDYGTAGFRADASLLPGVVFRCGILTALRVRVTGKTCGLVVTASHNPEKDNGVKIVDFTGEMLNSKWEALATEIASATGVQEIVAFCERVRGLEGFTPLRSTSEVVVGHDTRPTSPALAEAAKEGISLLDVKIAEESGPQTTPQVHFRVWRRFNGLTYGEFQWFKYLAGGYMRMARSTAPIGPFLKVDCANGIGADKLQYLNRCPGAKAQGYYCDLENEGGGHLNHLCGADYVQKEKTFPTGFSDVEEGQRCASLDGDADRVVFFTKLDNKFVLFDGDKIAALAAIHIKDILSLNKKFEDELTVGVVQTAYANGASTDFIRNVLQIPVSITSTGVKHLHEEAKKYDFGIYFEANGHGTIVVQSKHIGKFREMSDIEDGAFEFLALAETMNQATGDAISALFMVEAILRQKKWTFVDWAKIYDDLPSVQKKVVVEDRSSFTTTDAERNCLTPKGLQQQIDAAVGKYKSGRAFVRPSGTEDVVRVYAEASTQEDADLLAKEVAQAVYKLGGGIGTPP